MRVIPANRPWEQLGERDRDEAMDVHADVELAAHRFQATMAVPMKVDAAAMLAVPAAKRVVAQHQLQAVDIQFSIVADARSTRGRQSLLAIVVVTQQVLRAV